MEELFSSTQLQFAREFASHLEEFSKLSGHDQAILLHDSLVELTVSLVFEFDEIITMFNLFLNWYSYENINNNSLKKLQCYFTIFI